jgi:PHD/YefM family antitoxin component YafN of YafNO toxin-antitoxin module
MQIDIEDIHPLTEFQRNAKAHLSKVNRTGRPEVLTVNGKARGVLLGKITYERILDALEELATLKALQQGLEDMEAGRTVTAAAIRKRLQKR